MQYSHPKTRLEFDSHVFVVGNIIYFIGKMGAILRRISCPRSDLRQGRDHGEKSATKSKNVIALNCSRVGWYDYGNDNLKTGKKLTFNTNVELTLLEQNK
jgi:hypothetical protein